MLKRLATLVAILPMAAAVVFVPQAASATKGDDPKGNNGTVKIAEDGDLGSPSNDPHVGCTFTVEWYGFDKGSDIVSEVQFEMQAPTGDVKLTVDGPSKVFVGGDDNSGGGSAAGLDGRQAYTLSFKGAAHPQQGYHVKLTVNTPGSQGADKKSKVFWVTGCAETVTPAPKLAMTKSVRDSADPDTLASQDEILTYSFSVTNTGNVPLTNVTITDSMIPALAGGALCVSTLAVGATTTCPALPVATHVTTASEVASGKVTNTATATGTSSTGTKVTATGTANITTYTPPVGPTPAPAISLAKSVADSADEDSLASKDETLTYSFTVTNTGNVTLTNVKLTDAMIPALSGGALCVASLPAGATSTCPELPAATHVTSAADVAHGSVDNTATVVGTPPTGSNVSAHDSATIATLAGEEEPPGTPDVPFSWNWTYEDPTCNALTVEYPWNIPDGQANDVNVRINTNLGQVTLNFHNNEGFWSGNTEFDYSSHPNWPVGVTSYTVVWTQVGGTNYHWQGKVPCVINDDGDPATDDSALAVTSITGFRSGTVKVDKGDVVATDTVRVDQTGDEDLTLQKQVGRSWVDVKSVATNNGWARVNYGRQTQRGTFKYRLAVPGSTEITGACTSVLKLRVR